MGDPVSIMFCAGAFDSCSMPQLIECDVISF